MIPLPRLDLANLRRARGTNLQLIRHFLKVLQQTASDLPAQGAALPRLILAHFARYVVEFGAVADLLECFFFFAVLFAQDVAYVYGGRGLELRFAGRGVRGGSVFLFGFAFVFRRHGWGTGSVEIGVGELR